MFTCVYLYGLANVSPCRLLLLLPEAAAEAMSSFTASLAGATPAGEDDPQAAEGTQAECLVGSEAKHSYSARGVTAAAPR